MIAGIMSGTSLDGIDICLVRFRQKSQQWKFEIVSSEAVKYSEEWRERLSNAQFLSGNDLAILDREYGRLLGSEAKKFLNKTKQKADLVASHGHTIFHQIENQLSLQIGHGAYIAAESGTKVICDFRSSDTAYFGEGAPLVPLAEKILFPEYSCFINLGGIANISFHNESKSIGFDICVANQVLNYISQKYFGKEYDENGEIAAKGKLDHQMLEQLNAHNYYDKIPPKSLGREFTEEFVLPIIDKSEAKGENLLCTFNHHIADQIDKVCKQFLKKNEMVLSGGGAFNDFLIQLLTDKGWSVVKLDHKLIEFKEAICFAFLGLLRSLGENNISASVSGATKDSCGGAVYLP